MLGLTSEWLDKKSEGNNNVSEVSKEKRRSKQERKNYPVSTEILEEFRQGAQ